MTVNTVDIQSVRRALGALLVVDADFDAFCIDHYPHVYRRFTGGMDRVAKENLLLTLVPAESLMQTLRSVDPHTILPLASATLSADGTPAVVAPMSIPVQPPRSPYDRRFYVVVDDARHPGEVLQDHASREEGELDVLAGGLGRPASEGGNIHCCFGVTRADEHAAIFGNQWEYMPG